MADDRHPDGQRVQLWAGEPPHPGQLPAWRRRADVWEPGGVAFLACGPRWGKDRLSTWLNIWGLLRLLARRRAEGSRLIPTVLSWVVAPSSEDYEQVWREYVTHTSAFPRRLHRSKGQERIELLPTASEDEQGAGSIILDFKSGWNPDRLVGAGIDSAHVTEGAKLGNESYDHLRARLASPGRQGVQIINGTPTESPARWYVDAFRNARGSTDPRTVFVNAPSWRNPTLGDAQLEALTRIKESVSERRWRANWGAELVPEGAGLFRGLAAACTGEIEAPQAAGRYVKFWDLAGRGDDANVISVWRIDGVYRLRPRQVLLVRWLDASWDRSEQRVRDVCSRYPGELHWDDTARLAAGDRIRSIAPRRELLEPVTFTNTLKKSMVDHAIHMIESGKATLLSPSVSPDAQVQYDEMLDFQEKRTDAGNVRYEHPDGGHDDCVIGVLGALWAAREVGGNASETLRTVTGGTFW